MTESKTLLQVKDLKKYFVTKKSVNPAKRKVLKAVDGVSLKITEGETFGLVGESGCGKSTLGRTILKLHPPTDGEIQFMGENIEHYGFQQMRAVRQNMQIIFQDPYASLNPRKTVFQIVQAPLDVFHSGTEAEKREKVEAMLDFVGLGPQHYEKFPHEMSGGQRQRVGIARAMVLDPSFVVCDEAVSALDVSVRSQVLNLMKDAQARTNLSYLFISHDLSVVKYLCDEIAVMYLGKIVEVAKKDELFANPMHPYTKALLSAIPIPDVKVKTHRIVLSGDVPSPIDPPSGCRFHTRCPYVAKSCYTQEPQLLPVDGGGHCVSCLRAAEIN